MKKEELQNLASEHSCKPKQVIVHNPVEFGGFNCFDNSNKITSTLLFRDKPNPVRFSEDHNNFVDSMLKENLDVIKLSELLSESERRDFQNVFFNNPNFVYTRDSLITLPWVSGGYILGNLKMPIRKCESLVVNAAVINLGLNKIIDLPSHLILEGGDVIPIAFNNKKVLLIGYNRRTMWETIDFLHKTLIPLGIVDEIIGFKLAEWRINLDGCFLPVNSATIVCQFDSILEASLFCKNMTIEKIDPITYFEHVGFNFIPVKIDESIYQQVCNIFCTGNGSAFAYDLSDAVSSRLSNMKVINVTGSELVKGTGGPRCMTRPIY